MIFRVAALLLVVAGSASATSASQMYRVTADVLVVEVGRDQEIDLELGLLRDTTSVRVIPKAEVVISGVDRTGKKTTRGQRFIVTVPGFPARLCATTTIPYTTTTLVPSFYGSTLMTSVENIEVGTDIEVTTRPAGPGFVSVDLRLLESEALNDGLVETYVIPGMDSRIISSPVTIPPRTRAQRVISSVVLPLGSAIVVAGAPTSTVNSSVEGGAVIRSTPRGTFIVGGEKGTKEYDLLILLTVTEETPMTRRDADAMIEEFLNRPR